MKIVDIMTEILGQDAQKLADSAGCYEGKTAAQAIGEELARASMRGDIKAAAMLMELAGMDFRSRDAMEKHEIDRQKIGLQPCGGTGIVFEDVRPEENGENED